MSLPGETVEVLAATAALDPYSGEHLRESWATPVAVAVPGVLCEPRPSSEPTQDARNSVTSGWTLYMPAGTVIGPRNRVRVRDVVYRVVGEPADWRLGSWLPGVVVQTERLEG